MSNCKKGRGNVKKRLIGVVTSFIVLAGGYAYKESSLSHEKLYLISKYQTEIIYKNEKVHII